MKRLLTKDAWLTILYSIVDGEREFEIKKIGSSTAFLKDICYSSGAIEQNQGTLEKALKSLLTKKEFTAEELFDKPIFHDFLINWTEGFLYRYSEAWVRYFGLFRSIFLYNGPLDDDSKKIRIFFLQRIGKALLNKFVSIQNEHSLQKRSESYQYVLLDQKKEFIEIIQQLISVPRDIPLSWLWLCIQSLASLKAWENITVKYSQEVLEFIETNNGEEIRNVLLDKLANTDNNVKNDYGLIVDDCKQYAPKIYSKIEQIAPHWAETREIIPIDEENKNLFDVYANDSSESLFAISRGGKDFYVKESFAISR